MDIQVGHCRCISWSYSLFWPEILSNCSVTKWYSIFWIKIIINHNSKIVNNFNLISYFLFGSYHVCPLKIQHAESYFQWAGMKKIYIFFIFKNYLYSKTTKLMWCKNVWLLYVKFQIKRNIICTCLNWSKFKFLKLWICYNFNFYYMM